MTRHFNLAPRLPQAAAAVQQESAALYPEILSAVQDFRFDDIEESADGLIRIREQREGQRFPGRELVVRGDAVARDADHLHPRLGVRSLQIAEIPGFASAPGGHVPRVE